METPVGNPNVSLLPQPANPVPIEPMRGGGSENVSLLPQPTVPVPIEPMKGGQPEIQVGGAEIPIIKLSTYRRPVIKNSDTPDFLEKQVKSLQIREIIAYNTYRNGNPWSPELIDKIKPNDNTVKMRHSLVLDSESLLYVYFVYDFMHYIQITKKIESILKSPKKEKRLIFILVDKTKNTDDFSNIYRKFIQNLPTFYFLYNNEVKKVKGKLEKGKKDDNFQCFFLFDKKVAGKAVDWLGTEPASRRSFYYLEPDSICIEYDIDSKKRGLCFIPTLALPEDLYDKGNTGISPNDSAVKITFQVKKKGVQKIKKANELTENTTYTVDTSKNPREFWRTEHLVISLSEDLPIETGVREEAENENDNSVNTGSIFSEDEDEEEEEEGEKPAKPLRIFKINTPTTDLKIDLGDQEFYIRRMSESAMAAWKKGEYTPNETLFLDAIGINEAFIAKSKVPETPKNIDILEKRRKIINMQPKFLELLSTTTCLNSSDYLLKSECDFMRQYLQDLYYIRFIDRIQAVTQVVSGIDDFVVEMDKIREDKAARLASKILDILKGADFLLRTLVPKKKTKRPLGSDDISDLSSLISSLPGIAKTTKPGHAFSTGLDNLSSKIKPKSKLKAGTSIPSLKDLITL